MAAQKALSWAASKAVRKADCSEKHSAERWVERLAANLVGYLAENWAAQTAAL